MAADTLPCWRRDLRRLALELVVTLGGRDGGASGQVMLSSSF
jgi:hypothetical protein